VTVDVRVETPVEFPELIVEVTVIGELVIVVITVDVPPPEVIVDN
jgi:hypothetical protein